MCGHCPLDWTTSGQQYIYLNINQFLYLYSLKLFACKYIVQHINKKVHNQQKKFNSQSCSSLPICRYCKKCTKATRTAMSFVNSYHCCLDKNFHNFHLFVFRNSISWQFCVANFAKAKCIFLPGRLLLNVYWHSLNGEIRWSAPKKTFARSGLFLERLNQKRTKKTMSKFVSILFSQKWGFSVLFGQT